MKLSEVVGPEPVNQNQKCKELWLTQLGKVPTVTIKAGLPKTRPVPSLQPCGWQGQQGRERTPGGMRGLDMNPTARHCSLLTVTVKNHKSSMSSRSAKQIICD